MTITRGKWILGITKEDIPKPQIQVDHKDLEWASLTNSILDWWQGGPVKHHPQLDKASVTSLKTQKDGSIFGILSLTFVDDTEFVPLPDSGHLDRRTNIAYSLGQWLSKEGRPPWRYFALHPQFADWEEPITYITAYRVVYNIGFTVKP